MKKKVLAAALSLALAFSLAACSGSGGGNATQSTPATAQPESSAVSTNDTGSAHATPSTNSGTDPSTPDTPPAPPVGNPPAGNPPAGSPDAFNPPPAGGPGMMPPPNGFGAQPEPFATEYLGEGVKFEQPEPPEAGTQPSAPPTAESLADSSVTVAQDGTSVTVSHPDWGTKTVATDAQLNDDGTISIRTGTDQDGNPTYGMPLNLDAKWYAESGEVTLAMTPPAGGPMGGPGGVPGTMPPPPFSEPNGAMPIPEDSEWTANPGSSTLIANAS